MNAGRTLRLLTIAVFAVGSWGGADARAQEPIAFTQVEIELQFVEFNTSDIEPLAAKGAVDAASLRNLQATGKGQLLSAPKLVTHSGMEATFKVVTEYIYPSRWEVYPPDVDNTNVIAATSPIAIVPVSFDTREVGVILAALPEVDPGGDLINLTMTPELVFEPEWREYRVSYTDADGKEREARYDQPFFHARAISTSIAVSNGATILVGGGALSAMPDKGNGKMMYMFLTVQLVDSTGMPIRAE